MPNELGPDYVAEVKKPARRALCVNAPAGSGTRPGWARTLVDRASRTKKMAFIEDPCG